MLSTDGITSMTMGNSKTLGLSVNVTPAEQFSAAINLMNGREQDLQTGIEVEPFSLGYRDNGKTGEEFDFRAEYRLCDSVQLGS